MSRIALCLLLGLGLAGGAWARPARTETVYKGAIVVDAATGAVVFAENADEVSPPASMTKLMTFAVLDDAIRAGRLSLQSPVTVTADDARVGMLKDSTSVWLRRGEVYPVEELIYAMMIQSANDAAYALARTVGGTVPSFISAMNAKARSLGMARSLFRTPNGLPVRSHRIADGDLTTPRDFALLSRYLVTHTSVLKYTSVKSRTFGLGHRFPPTQMTNHNHLLGKFPEVDGLKTGFTNGAGFCLAATARRDGRRIIVVVMDCPDSRDRDLAVARLIQIGLALKPFVKPAITTTPAAAAASSAPPVQPAPPAGTSGDGATPAVHFNLPPAGH